MRHRAHRPVLDRLRPVDRTRAALAILALLVAALATGTALTGGGAARDTPAAGDGLPSEPGASTGAPTPTVTGSPGGRPRAERSPEESAEPTPASRPDRTAASRGDDRVEVPVPTRVPDPEAVPAGPQTTATTRAANPGRWVISLGADTDATYECSLDGGAYAACGSTVTYDELERGTHSFAARATDGDGNTDPSPATLTAEIGPRGKG
ncbi:MAG TPA: hypothetical protein VFV40_04590 [Nocardioides sp.]|nr:hypothetical protein [Nocardioides sp.]